MCNIFSVNTTTNWLVFTRYFIRPLPYICYRYLVIAGKLQYAFSHIISLSKSWDNLYDIGDVNDAAEYFQGFMDKIREENVPVEKIKGSRRKYPVWFTKEIINNLKAKERARRKLKKRNTGENLENFRLLRQRVKSQIKQAYRVNETSHEENIKLNPARFWQYIKTKRAENSKSDEKIFKDQRLCDPQCIAEAFAEHFSSVYASEAGHIKHIETDITNKQGMQVFKLQGISEADVDRAIKKLKNKRSFGPDLVPSYVYKGLGEFLIKPLTHIYNLSITTNTFPNIYQLTKVTPVPKTEDNTEVSHHRPVAQPSVPAKIFESIIREQIFIQIQNYIAVSQIGSTQERESIPIWLVLCNMFLNRWMRDCRWIQYTQTSKRLLTR